MLRTTSCLVIGAGLLWVGWFGFNGVGSALNSGALANQCVRGDPFCGAAGGLSWALVEWFTKGKPSVWAQPRAWSPVSPRLLPRSGFVSIPAAVCIGLPGRVFFRCESKRAFVMTTRSMVFGVHCHGQPVGMLMLGFLPVQRYRLDREQPSAGRPGGLSLAGGLPQFINRRSPRCDHTLRHVVTFVFETGRCRDRSPHPPEQEHAGLDVSEHGESAYN